MIQPPIMKSSSQEGHKSKNQKKSQGTTVPPSVGFGVSTGVVTAMRRAAGDDDDEVDVADCSVVCPEPDAFSVAIVDAVASGDMVVVSLFGRTV